MNWMVPEIDLDEEQRMFLNVKLMQQEENFWIKGHAGSGKSVLLVHGVKNCFAANNNIKIAIVVYTHALIDLLRTGLREIGLYDIPIMTYFEFEKSWQEYDIIFVDEVQDLPKDVLEKMEYFSKRIIAAGDHMQSIYEVGVPPEQINNILAISEYSLSRIHRLTRSIVSLVVKLIGNVGNILSAKINETEIDVQIKLGRSSYKTKEIEYVWKTSKNFSVNNEPTGILFPRHEDIIQFCETICDLEGVNRWKFQKTYKKPNYDSLNAYFNEKHIKFEYVGNKYGSLEGAVNNGKVILMTYHSSKGLDFEHVFLPMLTNDLTIFAKPAEKAETVFMVAMTRSRNNLIITYHGDKPHEYLDRICDDDCVMLFDIDVELNNDKITKTAA